MNFKNPFLPVSQVIKVPQLPSSFMRTVLHEIWVLYIRSLNFKTYIWMRNSGTDWVCWNTGYKFRKQNRFGTHHGHNSEISYLVPGICFSLQWAFPPPPDSEGSMHRMLEVLEVGKVGKLLLWLRTGGCWPLVSWPLWSSLNKSLDTKAPGMERSRKDLGS